MSKNEDGKRVSFVLDVKVITFDDGKKETKIVKGIKKLSKETDIIDRRVINSKKGITGIVSDKTKVNYLKDKEHGGETRKPARSPEATWDSGVERGVKECHQGALQRDGEEVSHQSLLGNVRRGARRLRREESQRDQKIRGIRRDEGAGEESQEEQGEAERQEKRGLEDQRDLSGKLVSMGQCIDGKPNSNKKLDIKHNGTIVTNVNKKSSLSDFIEIKSKTTKKGTSPNQLNPHQ